MTITDLETRIAQHKATRDQAIATIHALDGAIQEATYWLDQLKNPPTTIDALRGHRCVT